MRRRTLLASGLLVLGVDLADDPSLGWRLLGAAALLLVVPLTVDACRAAMRRGVVVAVHRGHPLDSAPHDLHPPTYGEPGDGWPRCGGSGLGD